MTKDVKKISKRATLRPMARPVSLAELLKRTRGEHSYREMARRCDLPTTTVTRLEQEDVLVPNRDTLEALAAGYGLPLDVLARATYGTYYEEVPEEEIAAAI